MLSFNNKPSGVTTIRTIWKRTRVNGVYFNFPKSNSSYHHDSLDVSGNLWRHNIRDFTHSDNRIGSLCYCLNIQNMVSMCVREQDKVGL
jgi:hypothetical protein